MSQRIGIALVLACLLAAPATFAQQAPAPNVTGTWTGTFTPTVDGQPGTEDSAHIVLKQTGAELTGSAGPNPDRQYPIMAGKVATTKDGTVLTFGVDNNGTTLEFELKLVDGRLKGAAKAERNGQKFSGAIDVARAK